MALTRVTDNVIGNADGHLNLSGIITASSFVGNVTGNVTGAVTPSGDVNVGSNIKLGAASGIITATSFSGDGSNLTSLPAGLGTALSSTQTSPLNKLYYTNEILSIGATVTVDHPATGTGAYTQYADIRLEEGADLIIEDGDDVIPDILGLGTDGGGLGAGGSGRIRVDSITNKNANGAPNFPNGLTGTAGTFTGAISAASGTITGNLGVGGVLTYEDVTNVDSVGVITARSGINLTGGVINSAGNINCTSGRLQRGSSTVQDGDAIAGGLNINGTDMDASLIMSVFGNDGDFTRISGSKSRNASVGSHSIVQDNDVLLSLKGFGSDGTNFEEAAQIEMQVDGTPGNNVMPGRIVFKTTTTDGVAERMRISKEGYVTKPNNPAFRARSSSGGWKSFGNTNFNTMPFDAEDFDSGGNYNTSTYKFTVPVAGKYYFYCQMLHDGTTTNGASSGKMQIYVGSDIVTFAKSGTQGEIVSCSTLWDCTVGEEVYCQGSTNTTNADDWHGDSYYSYFTGYLIG